jgi:hypothetical protein
MSDDDRDIEFLRSLDDEALLSMFSHGSNAILSQLGAVMAKQQYSAEQAERARSKAAAFDARVRTILQNIETRRGAVPARGRTSLIASAILRSDGGNIESIRRQVRRSLERQGLR